MFFSAAPRPRTHARPPAAFFFPCRGIWLRSPSKRVRMSKVFALILLIPFSPFFSGLESLSNTSLITDHAPTTDTTANLKFAREDAVVAPQPPPQPPSLRKLAMSHRMGAAVSDPSSPTSLASGDSHHAEVQQLHSVLPPPALTNALKESLKAAGSGAPGPANGVPNDLHFDSPYSRSISSTAPASPRM